MNDAEFHEKVMYMLGEIKSDLASIKEQTLKTNGRVTALEARVNSHQSFMDNMKGRIAVWSLFIGLAGTALWALIKNKLGL